MENLNSREIPEPQLLIKDHKKVQKDGHYPMRPVIPATNFVATFLKIGFMASKKTFDDNGVRYAKYMIEQASDLKTKLETLNLKQNEVTIMSLDIINMYHLTKLLLIKKSIRHYAQNLPMKHKQEIELCLAMIAFGMKTTL
eukprot:14594834-Ditylum_brightwellii.AAC.1